jgi:hypothetical protein
VREESHVFKHEGELDSKAGAIRWIVHTTEGIPIEVLSHRKARQESGLGHAGQRAGHLSQGRGSHQLPTGPGTGSAVSAATTWNVRDR